MQILLLIVLMIAFAMLVFAALLKQKKAINAEPLPELYKRMLEDQVPFYQQLDKVKRKEFETRVQQFLSKVKITGIKTTVEDIDRLLIAASAIIPIFNFHNWEYINLNEVLL